MKSDIRVCAEVTLSEISLGNKGSYGIAASAVDYSADLYTYLRITDISDDGVLNKESLKSVDDKNAYKYLLQPNDIVFARTGNSTGRSYFYDGTDGLLVYAGFLIKFSLDPDKLNPKYMKYYTMSTDYKNWVSSVSTGSTRGNINAQTYGNMKVKLPSREQQDFLVNLLSPIDDKIALNNQINKNLQSLSQLLFKHWFVDFEFPNEEGNPYRSSGGEMIESELGMIPKGWEVKHLSDLIDIRYGKDHKKLLDGVIPVYGSGGIMRYVGSKLFEGESVLIPRKGTLNNVVYVDEAFWTVDTMFYSVMKSEYIAKFVYHFVKSKDLASMNVGSAVPSMTTNVLNSLPIIVSTEELLRSFDNTLTPIYQKIISNKKENQSLINTRDTLLPKLMNGEIDVSNIEINE